MNHRLTYAQFLSKGTGAPMGCMLRSLLGCLANDLAFQLLPLISWATTTRKILFDTGQPQLCKSTSPAPNRVVTRSPARTRCPRNTRSDARGNGRPPSRRMVRLEVRSTQILHSPVKLRFKKRSVERVVEPVSRSRLHLATCHPHQLLTGSASHIDVATLLSMGMPQ